MEGDMAYRSREAILPWWGRHGHGQSEQEAEASPLQLKTESELEVGCVCELSNPIP